MNIFQVALYLDPLGVRNQRFFYLDQVVRARHDQSGGGRRAAALVGRCTEICVFCMAWSGECLVYFVFAKNVPFH